MFLSPKSIEVYKEPSQALLCIKKGEEKKTTVERSRRVRRLAVPAMCKPPVSTMDENKKPGQNIIIPHDFW